MRLVLGFVSSILACCAAAPAFRLPAIARPTAYELELTIIPRESEFRGVARISLVFTARTKSLWLNSKDLIVEKATINVNGAARSVKTTVEDEFLELHLGEEMIPGPARIEIAYRGQLRDKANSGLYRKSAGADWYAFTTFTPIDARRAFPCFDEPGYKAPWRIVLHVPQSDTAASNAPAVSERNEPQGMKRVEFRETKPLPSEVVALAVGPFAVVDAGSAGANNIPVRILAPRGRGGEAAAAQVATRGILASLEEYTGVPYPWEKLDHVAVLDMPFGAVENPGLITYRDRILLAPAQRDTLDRQRGMRATMAHELAHQWFGNLVTQAWWDDVWLSEGFATWLGSKTTDLELPVFERSLTAVESRAQIMKADASAETRPVRLAMNSRAEMGRVYGGMVYQKGAAVLTMLEQWLGPEVFQRGLRTYLSEHALANATTDDLGSALNKESGVDVLPVMHSFLDQAGFPVVRAAGGCAFESNGGWTIPLCVHGVAQCPLLEAGKASAAPKPCPAWAWPNRGGAGYFRVQVTQTMLDTIVWEELSAPEKLSLVDDVAASFAAHGIDTAAVLKALPAMARDPQPAVANAAYRLLLSMMTNAAREDRAKVEAAAKQILSGGRGRR